MKQIIFAAAAAVAFASVSAVAADLPTKAPYYKAPPAYYGGWSGCYIGGNLGGAWARVHDHWTPNPAGFPTSGPSLTANGAATLDDSGVIGGGQFGCNVEANRMVWGLEGDIDFANLRGSRDVA